MGKLASVITVGLAALALASGAQAKGSTEVLGKSDGFTYVKATGKVSAAKETDKVFAKCPGKSESIGGGSSLGSKEDGVYIAESSGFDPDGWFTSAHQASGVTAKVTSWAICTKDEKVKRYRSSAGAGGGNPFYHSVPCAQGAPVSGGNHTQGSIKNWILSASWTFASTSWATSVLNVGPTADLTAEVTCLKSSVPATESDTTTTDSQIVGFSIDCQTGEPVLGGGTVSEGFAEEVHLLESRPLDNLSDRDKVPDNAWQTTTYNDVGGTFEYSVYASCFTM